MLESLRALISGHLHLDSLNTNVDPKFQEIAQGSQPCALTRLSGSVNMRGQLVLQAAWPSG